MALVIAKKELTKKDLNKACKDYSFYIKITADIKQKIVIIGGQYHADTEKVLIEKYDSLRKDIWGGGFNLKTKKFETNALLNIKPGANESMEIIDSKSRKEFLKLVHNKLVNIENLT